MGCVCTKDNDSIKQALDKSRSIFDNDSDYHQFEKTFHDLQKLNINSILNIENYNIIPIQILIIIAQYSILKTTIINKKTKLLPNTIHKFEILEINGKNAILTTCPWNKSHHYGGKLLIKCNSLIIKNGGSIDLTGLGYKGATKHRVQGESYKGNEIESYHPNYGGGGGGGTIIFEFFGSLHGYGGGGGYGTKGIDGRWNSAICGFGGNIYGTNKLTLNPCTLYLGSGGGAGERVGTNGGGALFIECKNKLLIQQNCQIMVNGQHTHKIFVGCGSGGSIYLRSPIFINHGKIEAIGGLNTINSKYKYEDGNGGMGRIRIDCKEFENNKNFREGKIAPEIGYYGNYD